MASLQTNLFLVAATLWLMSGSLLPGGDGVKIKSLTVPEAVENGSQTSVILDCDYTLENAADKEGLVVKWYFNNQPDPVYQWILNEKPQDLGVLKGKLNLDYRASDDESKMHRALEIIRPTTELSGEYRCTVSTFNGEATQSKKMVIYVPQRTFQLTTDKENLTSRCSAEGLFPEPNMTISSKNSSGRVTVEKMSRDGLYDIAATIVLEDHNMDQPTTVECVLRIPETNYMVKRTAVFNPNSNAANWVSPHLVLCTTVISLISSRL